MGIGKKKSSHHVVHNKDGGWDVKRSESKRASGHFDTKIEAEKAARKISINQKTELAIHGMNGKIQRKDSHGNDPMPPKDKK